jgi:glycosyltransferase involved in cell wall biosynthesis
VSVAFITFQHALYVEEALRSALAQDTEFPVEIVIGDDCSTDGTSEIIERILQERKWPHEVVHLRHGQNLGPEANSNLVLARCKGDYLCILEGDDAWTDPQKLRRQVAFLNAHPEYVLCHHLTTVVDGATGMPTGTMPPPERRRQGATRMELFHSNFIMSSSVMVRRFAYPNPLHVYDILGDWPAFIAATRHGDIGYIDIPMSLYRVHARALWSSRSELSRTRPAIVMLESVVPELATAERRTSASDVTRHYVRYLNLLRQEGCDPQEKKRALRLALRRFLESHGAIRALHLGVAWFKLLFTRTKTSG